MIARAAIRVGTPLTAMAAVLAGCGSGADYANKPRPAAPITITAAITKNRILVSPARFGAGPITLIVTNQSNRSQELILQTNELGGTQNGFRQQTGPINPQGTDELKADVRQGTYQLRVRAAGTLAAALVVGAPRASAQDQLLEP